MSARMAPGPAGWPLVGNLPSVVGADDRIQFLLQLAREYGDVVRVRVGPHETCIVSRPECAEHVLIDNAANYTKGHAYDKIRVFLGEGLCLIGQIATT